MLINSPEFILHKSTPVEENQYCVKDSQKK